MSAIEAGVVAGPGLAARARWGLAPFVGFAAYLAAAVQLATESDHEQGPAQWAVAFGIAALVTAIAVVVARWALRGGVGRTRTSAAGLGVLAVLGIVVFWAGVPAVLGSAAVALAMAVRQATGSFSGPGLVGLVLGALALVMNVVTLVTGG